VRGVVPSWQPLVRQCSAHCDTGGKKKQRLVQGTQLTLRGDAGLEGTSKGKKYSAQACSSRETAASGVEREEAARFFLLLLEVRVVRVVMDAATCASSLCKARVANKEQCRWCWAAEGGCFEACTRVAIACCKTNKLPGALLARPASKPPTRAAQAALTPAPSDTACCCCCCCCCSCSAHRSSTSNHVRGRAAGDVVADAAGEGLLAMLLACSS